MFQPRFLDRGQLRLQYRHALEDAEVGVLKAHLKKVAAPDPEAEGAADVEMQQALEAMKKIERDWETTCHLLDERERAEQEEQRRRFPNAMRNRE